MGVEPTFLPPFPTPALSVHDHRRPRFESAHLQEVGASSDTDAGQQLRHRESVLRFSELAQVLRDWPLEFLADIAVLEGDRHRWVLRHRRPQPLSDITLTATRPNSLGTDTCHSAVDYLAFFAELGGPPPDTRHQSGRPQAPDALPPSLIRMRAMSQGIQGRHQPSTTFAGSPNTA